MTKSIRMNLKKPNAYFKLLSEDLDPVLAKRVKAAGRTMVKEVKEHMSEDGWDLNYEMIKEDVTSRVLGYWYGWYLVSLVVSLGLEVKLKDGVCMISKPEVSAKKSVDKKKKAKQ